MQRHVFRLVLVAVAAALAAGVFLVRPVAPPPESVSLLATWIRETATRLDPVPGEPPRITVITHGEPVELAGWLDQGRVTIFDFYSDDCLPCRMIKIPLTEKVEKTPGVSLRVVDIDRPGTRGIDFGSPVARQHDIMGLPSFVIYDGMGQVRAQGEQGLVAVRAWLEEPTAGQGP